VFRHTISAIGFVGDHFQEATSRHAVNLWGFEPQPEHGIGRHDDLVRRQAAISGLRTWQ